MKSCKVERKVWPQEPQLLLGVSAWPGMTLGMRRFCTRISEHNIWALLPQIFLWLFLALAKVKEKAIEQRCKQWGEGVFVVSSLHLPILEPVPVDTSQNHNQVFVSLKIQKSACRNVSPCDLLGPIIGRLEFCFCRVLPALQSTKSLPKTRGRPQQKHCTSWLLSTPQNGVLVPKMQRPQHCNKLCQLLALCSAVAIEGFYGLHTPQKCFCKRPLKKE